MARRHLDWMAQAEKDFRHANKSLEFGDYEWACFAAQQSAEKALKAMIESRNGKAFGHSLKRILALLNISDAALIEAAMRLDKHYIPTRYPNGYDEGAPQDYYSMEDASQSIQDAEIIINYCKDNLIE